MDVLLPAWFVPGIAGYVMHRRTRIERTSGLSEPSIHALTSAPSARNWSATASSASRPLRSNDRYDCATGCTRGTLQPRSALTTNSIELIACRPWTPPAVVTRPTGLFVR